MCGCGVLSLFSLNFFHDYFEEQKILQNIKILSLKSGGKRLNLKKCYLGKRKMTEIINRYLPEDAIVKMKDCNYVKFDGVEIITCYTPDGNSEYEIKSREYGLEFTLETCTQHIDKFGYPKNFLECKNIYPTISEEEEVNKILEWAKYFCDGIVKAEKDARCEKSETKK